MLPPLITALTVPSTSPILRAADRAKIQVEFARHRDPETDVHFAQLPIVPIARPTHGDLHVVIALGHLDIEFLTERIGFLRVTDFEFADEVGAQSVGLACRYFEIRQIGIEVQRPTRFHGERISDFITQSGAGVYKTQCEGGERRN